jgi:hypothetical protein
LARAAVRLAGPIYSHGSQHRASQHAHYLSDRVALGTIVKPIPVGSRRPAFQPDIRHPKSSKSCRRPS